MLTHGRTAADERAKYEAAGRELPEHCLPPVLMPGAGEWLDAFWEMSTDRRFPGGPIPRESVERWPVAPDEFDQFLFCIRSMDEAFLSHSAKGPEPQKMTPDLFKEMARKRK